MSYKQYDANQSGFVAEVVASSGTSIPGAVRVIADDTKSKQEIINQLMAILSKVTTSNWP